MKKIMAQGAESKLYHDKRKIIKHRFSKKYRIPELDEKLRSARTRREAKVLQKLAQAGFPAPKLMHSNSTDMLEIERIRGPLVKDILNRKNCLTICSELGCLVADLHNLNIIHGDLTTSNMILGKNLFLIDFGLSFFSHKVEDKAVDLHLLKGALKSRHHAIAEQCYGAVMRSYSRKAHRGEDIVKRLGIVGSRGRYKGKR